MTLSNKKRLSSPAGPMLGPGTSDHGAPNHVYRRSGSIKHIAFDSRVHSMKYTSMFNAWLNVCLGGFCVVFT